MDVKLYLTPTCKWSAEVKEWLKKKKIPFQEMDVSESSAYRDELLQKSGMMAVPLVDVDGKIIQGFHPEKIEELLK